MVFLPERVSVVCQVESTRGRSTREVAEWVGLSGSGANDCYQAKLLLEGSIDEDRGWYREGMSLARTTAALKGERLRSRRMWTLTPPRCDYTGCKTERSPHFLHTRSLLLLSLTT